MGGKHWTPQEEEVFWTRIVPLAPPGQDQDSQEAKKNTRKKKTWGPLAKKMTKEMKARKGEDLDRTYSLTCVYEHYFQNYVQSKFSTNAPKHVKGYVLFLIRKNGGLVSNKHREMLKKANRILKRTGDFEGDRDPDEDESVEDFNAQGGPAMGVSAGASGLDLLHAAATMLAEDGNDKNKQAERSSENGGGDSIVDADQTIHQEGNKFHDTGAPMPRYTAYTAPRFNEGFQLPDRLDTTRGYDPTRVKNGFTPALSAYGQRDRHYSVPDRAQMGYEDFRDDNMRFHRQMNADAFHHLNDSYHVRDGLSQRNQPNPYADDHGGLEQPAFGAVRGHDDAFPDYNGGRRGNLDAPTEYNMDRYSHYEPRHGYGYGTAPQYTGPGRSGFGAAQDIEVGASSDPSAQHDRGSRAGFLARQPPTADGRRSFPSPHYLHGGTYPGYNDSYQATGYDRPAYRGAHQFPSHLRPDNGRGSSPATT